MGDGRRDIGGKMGLWVCGVRSSWVCGVRSSIKRLRRRMGEVWRRN
jgi:hypothetical protein